MPARARIAPFTGSAPDVEEPPRHRTSVAEVADRLARGLPSYTPKHLADKILTSRAALEGERKLVTVVFADCVGFTQLSLRLDPEDLHVVMDGCFHRVLDAVHRYEGTVNQFTGDGVMALFGAPVAHEDHAVRAVAAALAIQKAAREYGEILRRERGLDFALRLGVNTGPVVVGKIGDDLRMDYTAQGETVNLAARLQQAAPSGSVVISEATHRLVAGYFVTEDLGERALKGFDHALRAYAVRDRLRRGRFDLAVERGLTPFVGRGRELGYLEECVERARGGRGQLVSIVGDAGVGKSRLVYELKRTIRDVATVVEAQCASRNESLPLQLVVDLVEASVGIEDGDSETGRAEKLETAVGHLGEDVQWTVPYLRHLLALPETTLDTEGLDQAQRRLRMMEAVKAVFVHVSRQRPLVIVAHDIHAIDPSSEDLLRGLVDVVAGQRIVLLGTYRPGWAPAWAERAFHHRVVLEALDPGATAVMVRELLGPDVVASGVGDLIAQRTEGNPLFVEELTRYLRERRLGSGTLTGAGEVPETIHDLLTARIDRLPEPLKRTLQLASVLGREFTVRLLEAIAPADLDVPRALADLVGVELLREKDLVPEPRYTFTHALVRDVAYQALLLKARADLHGRAGEAIERLYPDRADELAAELGEHYLRSADRARALPHLVRAGDRASWLFAYEDAARCFRRALELVDPASTRDRVLVLDRLGEAAFAGGSLAEARERWTAALAAAGTADGRSVADLDWKIATACWAAGDRDEALARLEHGLRAIGDGAEDLAAARIYHELARIHFRLGNHAEAVRWAEPALDLGTRLGAPDVVAQASNTRGVALARGGDIEGGAAHVTRALETALASGLSAVACRAYANLAVMYGPLDRERALSYARDGLALAEKIGDRLQQSWLYCALASGQCSIAGDFDEGVRAAEAAVELDRRLGQRNHLAVPLVLLAQIYQCRGEHERSRHNYREALAVAEAIGEPQLLFPCYDGLATLAIESGDEADADAWLARCEAIQQATGWSSDTFLVLPFLC